MKMQHAVAAALFGLGAHAAHAASEGGDTWSSVAAQAGVPWSPIAAVASTPAFARDPYAAAAAGEDGDTWSAVLGLRAARSAPVVVATTASLAGLARAPDSPYGSPATPDAADRAVRLAPGMRSIDASWGERIVFIAPDEHGMQRSFAWRFDVSPMQTHIDLNGVAPSDFASQGVRVFVAARPEYRGG
jgi:hypothetical protein